MTLRRRGAMAGTLAAALALAGCGGSSAAKIRQSGPTAKTEAGIARPYGHGSSQVWVLTPKTGKPRSIVVFIHGWTATSPFEWHQVWLDHLLERGSAVVFPVYQSTGDEGEFVTARLDLRSGLRMAFRVLRNPDLPVVVAGYSVGGALAFFYAADARYWGIPPPEAVYSIFPADPLRMDPGLVHLGPPSPKARVLILVGDRDEIVGRWGADTFWKWLGPVPPVLRRYRVLHSDPKGLFFDHEAPTNVFLPAMRKVFWQPLDRFVSAAQRS